MIIIDRWCLAYKILACYTRQNPSRPLPSGGGIQPISNLACLALSNADVPDADTRFWLAILAKIRLVPCPVGVVSNIKSDRA